MITARLHGRLGNQMFQYAAARALALRLGVAVGIDPREAEARGEGVLTRVFDLPLRQPDVLPPPRKPALPYLLWRVAGRRPRLHRERGLGYDPAFEHWPDGAYLHGYWQSERYFAPVADRIRADFAFPPASPRNAEMAQRIAAGVSVSLHVRRGDYVALGNHGLCDQAYYEAALQRVAADLPAPPTVFVFSDDPGWARDNLPLPFERVIVDFNGPDADFEDMHLMTLCQHNVVANSSFSWWAAWLNRHPGKRVAAPRKWFGDPALRNPDILPHDWLPIG
ncbi:MAG: alpha-1,2-fucosyltransferase [Rhodobacteraceae bacterium]|nr:alpha-1,2-fucosyltransferase [Paracoccaceae bacterium]